MTCVEIFLSGPGPARYALPPTIGFMRHDLTKPMSPAFTFHSKMSDNRELYMSDSFGIHLLIGSWRIQYGFLQLVLNLYGCMRQVKSHLQSWSNSINISISEHNIAFTHVIMVNKLPSLTMSHVQDTHACIWPENM